MTLIKSMTGYGRAVETVNGREFTVELRSVNNRYLDCSVRLPRVLSFAEDAVKQAVKKDVSRGKVDVFISLRSEGGEETKVSLNTSVLEGYLGAMRQMVAEFGVRDDISTSTVSRLPEVFVIEKPEVDEEQLLADLMSVVARRWQATMLCAAPKDRLWSKTCVTAATPFWNLWSRWKPATHRPLWTTAHDWRHS